MGLRELLILVLILGIIGVVLRGLFVAMSSRRNQIRVALDRNIPEYDLEELELRELPSGGARMVERSFAHVVEKNRQQDAREAARTGARRSEPAAPTNLRRPVADWQSGSGAGVRTLDRSTGTPIPIPAAAPVADLASASDTGSVAIDDVDTENIPTLTDRVTQSPADNVPEPEPEAEAESESPDFDESFAEMPFGSPLEDDWHDEPVSTVTQAAAAKSGPEPAEPEPEAGLEFEAEPEPQLVSEPEADIEPAPDYYEEKHAKQELKSDSEVYFEEYAVFNAAHTENSVQPDAASERDLKTETEAKAETTPEPADTAHAALSEIDEIDEADEQAFAERLRALAREAVTDGAVTDKEETSRSEKASPLDEVEHDSLDAQIFVDDYSPEDDDDEDFDDDMDPADDDDDEDYRRFEDDDDEEEDEGDPGLVPREALTQSSWLDETPSPAEIPDRPLAERASHAAEEEDRGEEWAEEKAEEIWDDATAGVESTDSNEDVMASRDREPEEPTYYYYTGGPYHHETQALPEPEPALDDDDSFDDEDELLPEEEIWDQSQDEEARRPAAVSMQPEFDEDQMDVLLEGYDEERNERLEALAAQQEKGSSRLMAWASTLLSRRRERKVEAGPAREPGRKDRAQRKAAAAEAAARQQELELEDTFADLPTAEPQDDQREQHTAAAEAMHDASAQYADEPDYHDEAASETAPAASSQEAEYSEVLVVNVMAREGEDIAGEELLPVLMGYGLRFGEMNIFHRHAGGKQGPVVFSVANILNPGTFDLNQISEFTTKGLCFFLTLPSVIDNMKAFDQMLATAAHVAEALDAELKDDYRSVMTAQTVEHYREQIRNFELRQIRRSR